MDSCEIILRNKVMLYQIINLMRTTYFPYNYTKGLLCVIFETLVYLTTFNKALNMILLTFFGRQRSLCCLM